MEGCNPNEAAVHGTAILYGPNIRRYMSEYSRFAEARAARIIRDAQTLAAAVQNLIAPDQAAAMIHAAWDVASLGAEVTDRILDLLQDTLDLVEAR
jgi:3-deoxy-D-manno-octulosonic-acid transferase